MTERWTALTGMGWSDGTVDGLASSLYSVGRIFLVKDQQRFLFEGAAKPGDSADRK